MSAFRSAAADYLAIRRAVGFKLRRAEGLLFSFAGFLEAERATRVTTQLALRWATLPAGATPGWWNSRLCVARGFARHMSAIDPATEVPPTDLLVRLGPGSCRAEPYLTRRPRSPPSWRRRDRSGPGSWRPPARRSSASWW